MAKHCDHGSAMQIPQLRSKKANFAHVFGMQSIVLWTVCQEWTALQCNVDKNAYCLFIDSCLVFYMMQLSNSHLLRQHVVCQLGKPEDLECKPFRIAHAGCPFEVT